MSKPFWLVWNEMRDLPSCKHQTEEDARVEAERLARQNPGERFHVLALVDTCQKIEVIWDSQCDYALGEVPF